MKKLLLTLFLGIIVSVPFASADKSPVNTQILSNGGSDDSQIQKQIDDAKAQVAAQGPGFGLVGKIEHGKHSSFSVNGEDIIINDKTQIYGDLKVGATGEVTGKILDGNKKVADTVVIAAPQLQSNIESSSSLDRPR